MFRNLRSILNHSRPPFRVASKNAKVYRVRFLPSSGRLSLSRTVFTLSAYSLIGYYWYRTVLSLSKDEPIFIPLSFPRWEASPRYSPDDPEIVEVRKFAADARRMQQARQIIKERAIQALEKAFGDKLGGNIKVGAELLYLHYPMQPSPVCKQRGIQISYTPTEKESGNLVGVFEISHGILEWDRDHSLKKERILYPKWMYYAVKAAFQDIYHAIRSQRNPLDDPIENLDDAIQYGAGLLEWTYHNFKEDLRKTRGIMPPPGGHMLIDGVIEVVSSNLVVAIDLTGSFNPANLEEITIQRMKVRFISRRRKFVPRTNLVLVPNVKAGLKEDVKKIAAVSQLAKQSKEQSDKFIETQRKPPPSLKDNKETDLVEGGPIMDGPGSKLTSPQGKKRSEGMSNVSESEILQHPSDSSRSSSKAARTGEDITKAGDKVESSSPSPPPPSSRPLDK